MFLGIIVRILVKQKTSLDNYLAREDDFWKQRTKLKWVHEVMKGIDILSFLML